MTETIIAALISAGAATLVCLVNNIFQQRKTEALLTYKLDELTKRVDKHNVLDGADAADFQFNASTKVYTAIAIG